MGKALSINQMAWEKAQKKGFRKPILTRMPAKIIPYVGFGL